MSKNEGYVPEDAEVKSLGRLLRAGQGLKAWDLIRDLPGLGEWRGFEGRHIASRLAQVLGNRRHSAIIDYFNWKENRENHRAYFRALFTRFGYKASPLLMLEMLERLKQVPKETEEYCDLTGLIATCYGDLREFLQGHHLLDQVIPLSGDPSWLYVQRALLLRREDRYEESLEAVLEGRSCRRYYAPVETVLAEALISLNRDDEAIDCLLEASEHSDNPCYPLKLSVMYSERDDIERTSHWLEEYERKSPLLSKESKQWLAGRRADLAYLGGDIARYLELTPETKEKSFQQRCAKYYRENDGENGTRKRLDVQFVRQHSMTCAPATLAALSSYFGKEHDHLKIAEAICYDGTPWHKERGWAEENGFEVREFDVTFDAARKLIDSGLPFTLTTQGVTSAHLQACIGYDEKLGLLLLRDPTHRHYGEVIYESLYEDHPVMGLRGMVFVPAERASELNSIELPKSRVYDLYHQFSVALDQHDQRVAEEIIETFGKEAPDEPLRFYAECRLASYKGHPATELERTEVLAERFPKNQSLWLRKLRLLNQLSRHAEARQFLAEIQQEKDRHPIFDTEQGELLCDDIRTLDLGAFFLRRALRHQPDEGRVYAAYARCLSTQLKNEEALLYRRAASRLSRSFEPYAQSYYSLAKTVRKEGEALEYLYERAKTVGDQEVEPHLTLLDVLNKIGDHRAAEMAEDLLKRFPENGDLLLRTVTLFTQWNRGEDSVNHLKAAEGRVPRREWLSVAARASARMGDRMASYQYWKELAGLEPLSVSAHESIARHLAEEENRDAAIDYLGSVVAAASNYLPLMKSYVDWLEAKGPSKSIPVIQRIVELDPEDLWARRELALEYSKDKNHELARQHAREALARDPKDWHSLGVMGWVESAAGEKQNASASFREALRLSIDHLSAVRGLMKQCQNYQERKEALDFIRDEMVRQVSDGDIIPEYREIATGVISVEDLQKDLELFCSERPDLWQAWATLREHLSLNEQGEAGLKVALQFTERFPLVPRSWVELGFAYRMVGLIDQEIESFMHAIDLSPTWDWILRELSQSLEQCGRIEEALEMLERAIQADPLAVGGYGRKANLLWKIGEREEALETMKRGLRVAPYYSWGWTQLVEWTQTMGLKGEISALLEELKSNREQYWRWWDLVAEVRSEQNKLVEALEALDKGLGIAPTEAALLDQKAFILSRLGRFSEARTVCQQLNDPGPQPVNLRGREAWILMQQDKGEEAWDRMKALSEEEPDYYFAHSQLALWAFRVEAWPELRDAAKRMIALRPEEGESWGYLGVGHERLKEFDEAHQAYSRALRIEPDYLYAARHKAEIEVRQKKYDEAAATLARIKHHAGTSFIVGDEIELLLKRTTGELPPELSALWEELAARSIDQDEDPYHYTDSIFKDANRLGEYDVILSDRACEGKLASPAEARAWGRRVAVSKRRKKLIGNTMSYPLSDEIKASFLRVMIQEKSIKVREREKLITVHKSLLESHADSWKVVLNFYVSNSREDAACALGKNWREFKDELTASDLTGYAACVDDIHGLETGLGLRKEILSAYPGYKGSEYLRICVAFHYAASGRLEEAEAWLEGVGKEQEIASFYKTIYLQTRAMVAARLGEKDRARALFGEAANVMRDYSGDKALQKYLKASAEVIATTLGIFGGKSKKLIKKWGWNILKDEGSGILIWWILFGLWVAAKLYQCTTN